MSKPKDGALAPLRWNSSGLLGRFALAIMVPAIIGGLVASFVPWSDWRWPAFAIASQLASITAWIWLWMAVVRRLEGLARALEPGGERLSLSRGGGLGGLVDAASERLDRERDLGREVEQLASVRAGLMRLTDAAAEWADTERAPAFPTGDLPEEVRPLADNLALAAGRLDDRAAAARAVALQVKESVADAGARSTQVASAAERQFIEASSLLTVLRGLERWSGEVQQGVEALAAALDAQVHAAKLARDAAGDAANGAAAQLDAANRAMERVRLAARDLEKVHEESRFAALESAHAALTTWSPGAERLAEALTMLIRATQAAQERARELEGATRVELAAAHEDFGALKARLASGEPAPPDDAARDLPRRALERVHEMVKDAIARGERLVQQAERTSSEAQRAGEGVSAAADEVEGLHVRFAEIAPPPPPEPEPLPAIDEGEENDEPTRPLRVLGPEDLLPDDETWSHG